MMFKTSLDAPILGSFALFFILIFWILVGIVHVNFAVGVLNDVTKLLRQHHRDTFLVSGWIWALATLLGGVFVAAVYWVIHHSQLRVSTPQAAPAPRLDRDEFSKPESEHQDLSAES